MTPKRGPVWPFPVKPLDYPTLPPGGRPVPAGPPPDIPPALL